MLQIRHPDPEGFFDRLTPQRQPETTEENAENEALKAYEDRFGHLPFNVSMPVPTAEELWAAINAGQAIEINIPEGADS